MFVVIDNYDSFTYNLVQQIGKKGFRLEVYKNDGPVSEMVEQYVLEGRLMGVVISPGPGTPEQAGCSLEVVRRFSGRVPILGICLGHQCVGQAAGAVIQQAKNLMHGKTSPIYHRGTGIFSGLDSPLTATRYHSLLIQPGSLPAGVRVTARTEDGEVMAIRYREEPTIGLQFHPESVLTPAGDRMIDNFIDICRRYEQVAG